MRRLIAGLVVTVLAVLSLAGSASAATRQVTHFRFHGAFADAAWSVRSATRFTETFINVSRSKQGSQLFVDQFKGKLDKHGRFAGGTDTFVDVTSGFSFAINKSRLTSARLSGSGLRARTCVVTARGRQIHCRRTTINVKAAWTGHGPIGRSISNSHFKTAGFSINDHFNGTSRAATATGTVVGLRLRASALQFADLGTAHSGTVTRCIGTNC